MPSYRAIYHVVDNFSCIAATIDVCSSFIGQVLAKLQAAIIY